MTNTMPFMSSAMPSDPMRPASLRPRTRRRAFTLIELLVVIAIISILVALLFPVFATARESARESVTSTHLHDIQNALALYKLDNKQYPPVLFAYATCASTVPCVTTVPMGSAVQNPSTNLVGLYPTYVKDWHDFTCPDNPIDDPSLGENPVSVNTIGTVVGGQPGLSSQAQTFYAMDAMDVSPQINTATSNQFVGGSSPVNWKFIARYQTSWDSYRTSNQFPTSSTCEVATPPATCLSQTQYSLYTRQLRWTNPPANTYVTSVTYHVPNRNAVMVLYESGTVVTSTRIGVGSPTANYDDSAASVGVTGAASTGPDSPATFWQFNPNQ